MINLFSFYRIYKYLLLYAAALLYTGEVRSQDIPVDSQKFIFFPLPMKKNWTTSIGITATTMPYDITEEFQYRIPAGDFHVIRKMGNHFILDGRVNFQIFQNLITVGPHWVSKVSDRLSISAGDNIGYWFGAVNSEGFKTKGKGWQNFPTVSLGYRFNRQALLTFKADAIMNLSIDTRAGETKLTSDVGLLSGSSYALILEQPFSGKTSMSLGFRAIYTNFFWQTWALFENFDRNHLYPQIIIGLIL